MRRFRPTSKLRRGVLGLALSLAAVIAIAGCGTGESNKPSGTTSVGVSTSATASASACQGCTTLTLTYTVTQPDLNDIALFYAQNHGLFAKHHLTLHISMVNGDTLGLQALASGSSDIAWISNQLLYQSVARGVPIKGFFEDAPVQDYELVGSSKIHTLKELEGKVLATSGPGGIAQVLPFVDLAEHGVDTTKIRELNAGGSSARLSALIAGRAQAGLEHVIDVDKVLEEHPGEVNVLSNIGKDLPGFQFVVFTATPSTIRTKRSALVGFSEALIEAQRVVATHESAAVSEFRKYEPSYSEAVVRKAYSDLKSIGSFATNGGMSVSKFEFTTKALLGQHVLTKAITYNQAYDTSIRNEAVKGVGGA